MSSFISESGSDSAKAKTSPFLFPFTDPYEWHIRSEIIKEILLNKNCSSYTEWYAFRGGVPVSYSGISVSIHNDG